MVQRSKRLDIEVFDFLGVPRCHSKTKRIKFLNSNEIKKPSYLMSVFPGK